MAALVCCCATVSSAQTPGGVSGAAIWLKANAGVTTGATFTWADQSGNSRNGTQTTATNQPTVNSNLINYNPALVFDGTNDYLTLANISALPTGAAQVEAFAVARNLNTGGSWNHIIAYGSAAANSFFTLGKQSGTANAISGYNGNDALSTALEYTGGTTVLCDGKYTGTQGVISTFGTQKGTVTFTAVKATTNGKIGVDPTTALSTCWNGNIAETILFPTNLSAANVQKVNSYLAIKYGITIDQTAATNYLASDATVVWDGTTNSSYKGNIAGIGRDDSGGAANSGLNQKQSKSVNTASSGDLVAMGLTTIATDNASNANTFSADKSFLTWGDNAGANAWQSTESPSAIRQRLTREWKVQETGTVGNVVVRTQDNGASSGGELPVEVGGTVYLLVDADGDFSAGATEYPMTLTGTNWDVTVDLTTGQFFTFATQVLPAPGGAATNLQIWYKAEDYNTGTGAWTDQSGLGNNGTTNTNGTETISSCVHNITGTIVKQTAGINFNPSLTVTDVLRKLRTPSLTGPRDVIVVSRANATSPGGYGIFGTRNTSGANEIGIRGNTSTDWHFNSSGNASDFTFTASSASYVNGTSGTAHSNLWHILSQQRGTSAAPTDAYYIGGYMDNNCGGASGLNRHLDGDIAEVIVYNTANNSAANRQKVESYLAIKYGITKAANYLASDGTTTFWTSGGGYDNNIAGIGRDDLTALSQKQSKSINSGLQVVMGNGNTIAADNASNSNTFSADKSALIWGDNAGAIAAWTTTGAPASRQIVARAWKVQETGTVGSVKVQIADNSGSNGLPAEATTVYLLTDVDGVFSAGATETAMTLNGTNWEANVDLATGQFFTFATLIPPAPGGVLNSTYWVHGAAGVKDATSTLITTTGSNNVNKWEDQSGNAAVTTQATAVSATQRPSFNQGNANFNPSLYFDATQSDDLLTNTLNSTNLFTVGGTAASVKATIYSVAWGLDTRAFDMGGSNQTELILFSADIGMLGPNARVPFATSSTNSTGPSLIGGVRDGTTITTVSYVPGGLASATNSTGTGSDFTSSNAQISIGQNIPAGSYGTGNVAETVVYPTALTTTEQKRVESYLSLKYGMTKGHNGSTTANYVASDGTTILWAANSGYHNNIAGIARDDASALNQKQSKSVNIASSGDLVTIGLTTIATDNVSNTNTFSADRSALVWGDNAGAVTLTNTISGSPYVSMPRLWKVQETGTVGTVKIRIPTSAITLGTGETAYLIKSTDATITSTDALFPLTVNGSFYETTLDFTTGNFFTFGKNLDADVTLALAMTGDKTTVTSGQNITYTLTLTNSGTSTATNVKVKDQLPGGVTFVSATPSTGTFSSGTGIWTVPSIAPGSATLTIVVTAQ